MNWQPPSDGQTPEGWQASEVTTLSFGEQARRYWWAWAIVILTLVGLGSAALGWTGTGEQSADDLAYGAHAACAEFTRDRLRAPSTADFPEYDDRGVTISNRSSVWTVRSFVDSQNALGAMLRMEFACSARKIEGGWRLVEWAER